MNRRAFLRGITGTSLTLALGMFWPGVALAQNARLEIKRLLLGIQIDLLAKNFEAARQRALQLVPLSQMDPNWFNYPESFQIASILFKLTPRTDREQLIFAARGVLETYPGSTEGDTNDNNRTVATAAAALLDAASTGPVDLPQDQFATAAGLLLVQAGVAPGPERVGWAQTARRGLQRYGSEALADWSVDNSTPRFAAAGIAVSGDWRSATVEYEKVIGAATGAMPRLMAKSAKTRTGGMVAVVAGATTVESEGATAFAMAGRFDRALEVLEGARRNTLSMRGASLPSGGGPAPTAIALEDRLTRAGTVLVQPVVSLIGAFALVSLRRANRVQRFTAIEFEHGGLEFFTRMISSSSYNLKKDGLAPTYQRIRKDGGKDGHGKLLAYAGRAAEETELLIGSAIRTALRKAKVTGEADVLVILPANLATLPLGLAKAKGGSALGQEFRLRFADSLLSAGRAEPAARPMIGSVAIVGADPAVAGLPFLAFERASVGSVFPAERRKIVLPKSGFALAELDGTDYWHVASHASWNFKEPGKSGISFGKKQVVTVDDILHLRLSRPPRLVFLSACETALIDVQGQLDRFVGLSSALLAAGAGGVIASLWPVSDAATALLASKFYDEHIGLGRPPSIALRNAQRWLGTGSASAFTAYVLDKATRGSVSAEDAGPLSDFLGRSPPAAKPFENPYFWGGFQLYGR